MPLYRKDNVGITSVGLSGGSTGITVSGSPITSSGTMTLGGTVAIGSGGTGQTTQQAAIDTLTAVSGATAGHVLTKDGSGNATWAAAAGGATDLNGLSDAKADNFDLALGFEAGNDMDLSADNTYNVYVGGKSGYDSDDDTTQNVGVGYKALENNEAGSYQVAVGYEALNQGTTGVAKNTAIGWRALKGSTGGQENVAVGYGVFSLAGTGGDYNVTLGANAHANAHSNAGDVAIGYKAGFYGRDSYSIAVGYQAGYGNAAQTAGTQNVYLGAESGYKSKTSTGNIGVGYKSLYDLNDGEYNIGLGWSALENITDGDNNITIGKSAGDNITTGSDNIIIGNTVDASAADATNELRIGSGTVLPISANLSTGAVTINSAYTLPTAVTGSNGYVLTAQTDGTTAWAAAGGGGASDLNGLDDVECAGTAANYNFFKNGSTATGTPVHGTLTGTALRNIALGAYALNSLTSGNDNIMFGYTAGYDITEGVYNLGIGYQANRKVTTGDHNIALGDRANFTNITGNYNIGLGREANYSTTGGGNVSIGQQAGRNISSGNYNVIIGYNTTGTGVVTSGDKNIAIGMFTGVADPTADNQLVIGSCHTNPHYLLTGDFSTSNQCKLGINLGSTGSGNCRPSVLPTASLEIKGSGTTDSTPNLLIKNSAGTQIMKLTDSGENICIGATAGDSITAASGLRNILLGLNAGTAITTADNNICIGAYAGQLNTASGNMFIGYNCGGSNTTGTANTFIGYSAGLYNVDWQNSTYVGYQAGYGPNNEMNTAVGTQAMYGGSTANTAEHNTAIGYQALYGIDDNGDGNVAVGWKAGDAITSGTNNTVIGYDADALAAGNNQIAIGNGIATTATDQINIGGNLIGLMTASDRHTKFEGQVYTETHTLTDGATITPDFKDGNVQTVTLAGNRTLANPTNPKDGATYIVIVKQDGTGSRTLAYGGNYKWEGGTAPTLSTGANAVDILTFVSDGTNMYGTKAQNFS